LSDRPVAFLYERCGYREPALRPMVKEGWQNPGDSWVLLIKDQPQVLRSGG
jgi:hypothetical protein